jgi:hypothetical protein
MTGPTIIKPTAATTSQILRTTDTDHENENNIKYEVCRYMPNKAYKKVNKLTIY